MSSESNANMRQSGLTMEPPSAVDNHLSAAAMTNIPTELLRTLVAVVDLRSFTKAAQSLGVTQPAVSAQIKRLQMLLGGDLLDKSAPGVTLTSVGEMVVNYARRLLSINDQILGMATPRPASQTIRIGITGDFIACTGADAGRIQDALAGGGFSRPLRDVPRRCVTICARANSIL